MQFLFKCSDILKNSDVYQIIIKNQILKAIVLLNHIFSVLKNIQIILDYFNKYNLKLYNSEVINFENSNILHPADVCENFVMDNNFIEVCLNSFRSGSTQEKKKYQLLMMGFPEKTKDVESIIQYYCFNKNIKKDLKNHPLIVFKHIENLINSKDYNEAAMQIILKRSIFLNVKNVTLIKELVYLQMLLIRIHFNEENFHILKQLAFIDFTENIADDEFRAKFLLLSACTAISCSFYQQSIEILEKTYKLNCRHKQKAKASYLLGTLYKYMNSINFNSETSRLSKYWLSISSNEVNCFWSLLAMAELNKSPNVICINSISGVSSEINIKSDLSITQAKVLWGQGKYKDAIKYIHNIQKENWEHFSYILIDAVKYFSKHKNRAALYKIGSLCFKSTGKIIKECFDFPWYLAAAIQQNILTKDEAIELMAIASEESKFLDHSYYNLDTPTGLGIFQLHPNEIKKIANKLRILYNKRDFLNNPLLQIKLGIELFRYHKKLVNNSLLFALFYFVSGHKSYTLQMKTSYLHQRHPLHSVVILSHIKSGRTRRYLVSVLEFMLLQHFVLYNKFPNLQELL